MKFIKNNLLLILVVIIATVGLFSQCTIGNGKHKCKLEDCDMVGNYTFKTDAEEGTDTWTFQRMHWDNPTWTYEQIENAMFNTGLMDHSRLDSAETEEYESDGYHRKQETPECREYQIELNQDGSADIYDGTRHVGHLDYNETEAFHKLMIKDNL